MNVDIYNTTNKYKTIYADPPWNESGGGKIKRGADRHYNLMKTTDIIGMAETVKNLTDSGGHLYLWATNNHLRDAFKVIDAWGFRYVTMITWAKDRFGLGQYFRGQTEHCIFAVRGILPYKAADDGKRCQGSTLILSPRREHSRKPEEMRRMIERVSYAPRIELFSRTSVDGWDCWGNETDKFV